MYTAFAPVNTGYQARHAAPRARVARGGGTANSFSELLSNETRTVEAATFERQRRTGSYSPCANWLENRRIMSGGSK